MVLYLYLKYTLSIPNKRIQLKYITFGHIKGILEVLPSQEEYCGCTSKKYTWIILQNTIQIYFMHLNNIHWLVYQKIEELSFNSGVKHEKLVSPTERALVLKPLYTAQFTSVHNLTNHRFC